MVRMRTLDGAIAQVKIDDPESALTKHALRRMAADGVIPVKKAGTKILINYDALMAFLGDTSEHTDPIPRIHPIGRV